MAPIQCFSVCLTPDQVYHKIAQKGADTANAPWQKVAHQAFVGGCYIGFGGTSKIFGLATDISKRG